MSQWISCKERLPPKYKYVLVACPNFYVDFDTQVLTMMLFSKEDRKDYWQCFGRCLEFEKVTHWMALPEPPKELKKNLPC